MAVGTSDDKSLHGVVGNAAAQGRGWLTEVADILPAVVPATSIATPTDADEGGVLSVLRTTLSDDGLPSTGHAQPQEGATVTLTCRVVSVSRETWKGAVPVRSRALSSVAGAATRGQRARRWHRPEDRGRSHSPRVRAVLGPWQKRRVGPITMCLATAANWRATRAEAAL